MQGRNQLVNLGTQELDVAFVVLVDMSVLASVALDADGLDILEIGGAEVVLGVSLGLGLRRISMSMIKRDYEGQRTHYPRTLRSSELAVVIV